MTPPWSWLTDHPFGGRVLDLRAFSLGIRSKVDEPTRARFDARRRAAAQDLPSRTPEHPRPGGCELFFPAPTAPLGPELFRARRMEEKWDLYLLDDTVHFVRSWTGEVAFTARAASDGVQLCFSHVVAGEAWCDASVRGQIDFLVWTHLYGRAVPHPVPAGALEEPERAALWSFGRFGNMAWYAAEDDAYEAIRATGEAEAAETAR
jgi:hypothetical protein